MVQQQDVVTQEEEQMLQDIFPLFQTSNNVITMTMDAPLIGGIPQWDVDNFERKVRIVMVIILLRPTPAKIHYCHCYSNNKVMVLLSNVKL